MHGVHMEAQTPMGRKGGSGDGGVRSYSKVRGEPGNACEGRHGGCMEVHGGACDTSRMFRNEQKPPPLVPAGVSTSRSIASLSKATMIDYTIQTSLHGYLDG